MTVKELKEKLSDFDQDLRVVAFDRVNEFLEIIVEKDITVSKKKIKVQDSGECELVTTVIGAEEVIYIY